MREMADSMELVAGQEFTRDDALDWFRSHYPLVKDGTITAHLTRLSTNNKNRLHYSAKPDDDVFFQIDSSRFRRFDLLNDPSPIREGAPEPPVDPELDVPPREGSSEFAYEHDLRDYLARNLHLLEPGLRLYDEEGVTGVEFPAGGRYIDFWRWITAGTWSLLNSRFRRATIECSVSFSATWDGSNDTTQILGRWCTV